MSIDRWGRNHCSNTHPSPLTRKHQRRPLVQTPDPAPKTTYELNRQIVEKKRQGDYSGMCDVFVSREDGVEPNHITFSLLIAGAGASGDAGMFWEEQRGGGWRGCLMLRGRHRYFPRCEVPYQIPFFLCRRHRRTESMERILVAMETECGVLPSTATYNTVIASYAAMGEVRRLMSHTHAMDCCCSAFSLTPFSLLLLILSRAGGACAGGLRRNVYAGPRPQRPHLQPAHQRLLAPGGHRHRRRFAFFVLCAGWLVSREREEKGGGGVSRLCEVIGLVGALCPIPISIPSPFSPFVWFPQTS